MYIGYNIQKANESMAAVNTAYENVCKKVAGEWSTVQTTLRTEWVGPDEQDFEKRVVERIKEMMESSKVLTSNTIEVLYELAVAWANFQDSNNIGGAALGVAAELIGGLDKPEVASIPDMTITAVTFDAGTNMGLASKGSSKTISSSLDTFVKNVKNESSNLFESIDMSAAFFGSDQLKKLHKLRDEVGEAVGVISTSLSDFEKAMEELTNKAYDKSDEAVGQSLDAAKQTVMESLDGLGETRWK